MARYLSRKNIVILLIALLVIDQVVKIIVKTTMTLDQSITIFPDWFFIRFIENPGAAFGMQIGGEYGKLFLSIFRILLSCGLVWYINQLFKKRAPKGLIVGFVLILAGAVGNIIDGTFYGLLFSESSFTSIATLFPEGGGYAGFMHGKVVDMLYFPIIDGTYPSWFPFVGGDGFIFFSPVFNLADSYISIAVVYILLFQYKYYK